MDGDTGEYGVMTEPYYTTRDAILAANGLVAARLDWTRDLDDEARAQRFAEMADAAIAANDAGPVILGIVDLAVLLANNLAQVGQIRGGPDAVLQTIARTMLED